MFIRYKIGVFAQKHVGKHKKVTILQILEIMVRIDEKGNIVSDNSKKPPQSEPVRQRPNSYQTQDSQESRGGAAFQNDFFETNENNSNNRNGQQNEQSIVRLANKKLEELGVPKWGLTRNIVIPQISIGTVV